MQWINFKVTNYHNSKKIGKRCEKVYFYEQISFTGRIDVRDRNLEVRFHTTPRGVAILKSDLERLLTRVQTWKYVRFNRMLAKIILLIGIKRTGEVKKVRDVRLSHKYSG